MTGTSGVRYFAVNVSPFGRFASFSGGEPTVTIGSAWNGGAHVPDHTQSRKTYGNITVARPFNATRDRPLIRQAVQWIGGSRTFTITKQDLDANDVVIGRPDSWTYCMIVRVGEPRYAEDDSSPATWEIEFVVGNRG